MIDLDRLERLAAEATPGPWALVNDSTDTAVSRFVVRSSGLGLFRDEWRTVAQLGGSIAHHDDAEFIAACDPVTVAALVRAVKAALADDPDCVTYELNRVLAPFRTTAKSAR